MDVCLKFDLLARLYMFDKTTVRNFCKKTALSDAYFYKHKKFFIDNGVISFNGSYNGSGKRPAEIFNVNHSRIDEMIFSQTGDFGRLIYDRILSGEIRILPRIADKPRLKI